MHEGASGDSDENVLNVNKVNFITVESWKLVDFIKKISMKCFTGLLSTTSLHRRLSIVLIQLGLIIEYRSSHRPQNGANN